MLVFELASPGVMFTLTRLVPNLVGIVGMALPLDRLIPEADRQLTDGCCQGDGVTVHSADMDSGLHPADRSALGVNRESRDSASTQLGNLPPRRLQRLTDARPTSRCRCRPQR